jgi:hypothetical protein
MALGVWGSNQANLTVESNGAQLQTSCGTFTAVERPLVADGVANVRGVYQRQGGAPPTDGVFPSYPGYLSGTVQGSKAKLQINTDDGGVYGPYELRHGTRGNIILCP